METPTRGARARKPKRLHSLGLAPRLALARRAPHASFAPPAILQPTKTRANNVQSVARLPASLLLRAALLIAASAMPPQKEPNTLTAGVLEKDDGHPRAFSAPKIGRHSHFSAGPAPSESTFESRNTREPSAKSRRQHQHGDARTCSR